MKIDQNIKDAIKSSMIIVAIVFLIIVGIGIYDAVTNPESEEVYDFITFAQTLHKGLDENEVSYDIHNLIDRISSAQVEDAEEINSVINRESSILRRYREKYILLASPTGEMRVIKESLMEEASLCLTAYSYLREALESRINDDYNTCILNIESTTQYLEDALNLRMQNRAELDEWRIRLEAEISN